MRTLRQVTFAAVFVAAVYLVIAYAAGLFPFQPVGGGKIIIVRDGSVDIAPFENDDKKPKAKEAHPDNADKKGYLWKVKAKDIEWYDGSPANPCPDGAQPTRTFANFTSASIDIRTAAAGVQTLEVLSTKSNKLFLTFPDALTLSYDTGRAVHTVNDNGNTLFRIDALTVDGQQVKPAQDRRACIAFTK